MKATEMLFRFTELRGVASSKLRESLLVNLCKDNEDIATALSVALTLEVPRPVIKYNSFLDNKFLDGLSLYLSEGTQEGLSYNTLRMLQYMSNISSLGIKEADLLKLLKDNNLLQDVSSTFIIKSTDEHSCKLCGDLVEEGSLCGYCSDWLHNNLIGTSHKDIDALITPTIYGRYSLIQGNTFEVLLDNYKVIFQGKRVTGTRIKSIQGILPFKEYSIFN